MADLQELKKEADELGVQYPKNITAEKLAEKIEEFYSSKETVDPTMVAALEQINDVSANKEEKEEAGNPRRSKEELFHEKRLAREKAAKQTRIITIVDNDQRVNNHTTTCTVNCSNEYFDLGTIILPLNEKIEVMMGHIRTLKSVQIPLHVVDTKTGMSTVRMRPRYTISFEDK